MKEIAGYIGNGWQAFHVPERELSYYKFRDGHCILVDKDQWLPGVYADKEAAIKAMDYGSVDLAKVWVGLVALNGEDYRITVEDLEDGLG